MPSASGSVQRSSAAPTSRAPTRNGGADLDNIFNLGRGERPAGAVPRAGEGQRYDNGDLNAALDMLNRAARAMDLLQSRYLEVEAYAREVAERAEKDLSSAHDAAREWETRATAGENLAEDMKARLQAAERRVEQAERRAEVAERRADHAERGASETREWIEGIYGKIVAAFEANLFPKSEAA